LDITKAREVLGWQPRVDLQEGLRETVKWYLKDGQSK
jgi:dTDP-glucose 4,6-dehydratase